MAISLVVLTLDTIASVVLAGKSKLVKWDGNSFSFSFSLNASVNGINKSFYLFNLLLDLV